MVWECQELVSPTSMRSRGIFLNENCSEFAHAHCPPKEKMGSTIKPGRVCGLGKKVS